MGVEAGGGVLAGLGGAVADFYVAAGACVERRTCTGVIAAVGVADGTVQAWVRETVVGGQITVGT